jgi:divalent metal cation (Fe/Co/Zn/Cd) transporter
VTGVQTCALPISVASLIVVVLIVKVLYRVFWDAIKGLMDCSMNEQYGEKVEGIATAVSGVKGVHQIRTKQLGRKLWAELDIYVDTACSIEEAQRIAHGVRDALLSKIDEMTQVIVHFRPVKAK